METYLSLAVIASPLRLYDCCPFSDGAAAGRRRGEGVREDAAVTEPLVDPRLGPGGLDHRDAGSPRPARAPVDPDRGRAKAFRQAQLEPKDIDFVGGPRLLHDRRSARARGPRLLPARHGGSPGGRRGHRAGRAAPDQPVRRPQGEGSPGQRHGGRPGGRGLRAVQRARANGREVPRTRRPRSPTTSEPRAGPARSTSSPGGRRIDHVVRVLPTAAHSIEEWVRSYEQGGPLRGFRCPDRRLITATWGLACPRCGRIGLEEHALAPAGKVVAFTLLTVPGDEFLNDAPVRLRRGRARRRRSDHRLDALGQTVDGLSIGERVRFVSSYKPGVQFARGVRGPGSGKVCLRWRTAAPSATASG